VFGSSKNPSQKTLEFAQRLGEQIRQRDVVLLTGGRRDDPEGTVKQAAMAATLADLDDGQIGRAIAILPDLDHATLEPVSSQFWRALYVNTSLTSAERNFLSAVTSHAVIALEGGVGTLSELAFAKLAGRHVLFLESRAALVTAYEKQRVEFQTTVEEALDKFSIGSGGNPTVSEVAKSLEDLLASDASDFHTPEAALDQALALIAEQTIDAQFGGFPESAPDSPTLGTLESAWKKLEAAGRPNSETEESTGQSENGVHRGQEEEQKGQDTKSELKTILKSGNVDEDGALVEEVYYTTAKYQIYRAKDRIWYRLPDDFNTASSLRKRLYGFSEIIDNVQTMRASPAYRGDKEFAAKTLARATSQAFDSDSEGAAKLLRGLEQRMLRSIQSSLRVKYVGWNAGAFFLFELVLVGILFGLPHMKTNPLFPFSIDVLDFYTKLSMLGALGAFLSVSIGISRISVERDIRRWENAYTGAVRIAIGVIGAIIIGLALDSKFLSPGFGNDLGVPVYYLLAIVAGFSESFVPNTLRRAEQTDESNGKSGRSETTAP
jgi:uncharacterized protein (TIGR00725 family)